VVDDVSPDPSLGDGPATMLSVVEELSEFAAVSFLPTAGVGGGPSILQRLGVEVIDEPLDVHLRRPGVLYFAIVVSRPNTFDRQEAALREWQPQAPIVYVADPRRPVGGWEATPARPWRSVIEETLSGRR
jgi:hypothetical protein